VRIRRHGFRFRPPIAIEVMDERDERDEPWRPGGRGWKKIRRAVREETLPILASIGKSPRRNSETRYAPADHPWQTAPVYV